MNTENDTYLIRNVRDMPELHARFHASKSAPIDTDVTSRYYQKSCIAAMYAGYTLIYYQ